MAILIDGYNLIHSAGIVARKIGPGGLERARQALLDFLVVSLETADCARTTVVFDAAAAPIGREREFDYRGLRILFAVNYENADELIEELIKQDSAPRQLVVVSSDHRLHRAARRRRATAIDSDIWYAETLRRRMARVRAQSTADANPADMPSLSPDEIEAFSRDLKQHDADPIFPQEYLDKLAKEIEPEDLS